MLMLRLVTSRAITARSRMVSNYVAGYTCCVFQISSRQNERFNHMHARRTAVRCPHSSHIVHTLTMAGTTTRLEIKAGASTGRLVLFFS